MFFDIKKINTYSFYITDKIGIFQGILKLFNKYRYINFHITNEY